MTVLLTRDLAVVSQVDGAAGSVGATTRTVSSEEDARAKCDVEAVNLVIVDLGMPSLDVKKLVEQVKSVAAPPRIVAFGSHVHVEKLAAAREAGCDEVMSRGQFFAQLESVLRGG